MKHPLHTAYRESDVAVFVGENRIAHRNVVVVAVISVGAATLTRHLMVFIPLVQTAERVVAYTRRIVGAASESMEAVSLVEVETAESKIIIILKIFYKQIIFRRCCHGEIAEQICRGVIESPRAHSVGHEAHIHQHTASGRFVGRGHHRHHRAGIDVVIARAFHIVPVVAVDVGTNGLMTAPLIHITEVDVKSPAHIFCHCPLQQSRGGNKQ